ncbi:MAG: Nif3-like dinuclear metal center hexameric protein [Rikenellaceae bacterium]
MKVKEITAVIEELAPLSIQASYDNSGLIIGDVEREVSGALIAVDLTEAVVEEAVRLGVEMVITHHPIIFSPLKRLTSANCVERSVAMAIKSDLVIYAAHTNLDSAEGGMSWRLGEVLGLRDMRVLEVTNAALNAGFGVVGELECEMGAWEYMSMVAERLKIKTLRHSDVVSDRVQRVAICTGSGGSLIGEACAAGADMYVTADLRYNDFFEAQQSVTTLDVGHYESEFCVIDIIFELLSKKITNFALHKSLCGANPVHHYLVRS